MASFGKEVKINNWIKKYSVIKFPIGVTIEKTPKNVIAHFHQFSTDQAKFLTDFYQWIFKGISYVAYYLQKEKGIRIDIVAGEIVNEHIANERPDLDKVLPEGRVVSIKTGRKGQSIFPMKQDSKAWIDASLGHKEIETNDMLYEEKLLAMPETLDRLATEFTPAIKQLSDNIVLHLEVLKEIKEAVREMRKSKHE